jgi:TrmH family RNA methyltransferase
MTRRRKEPSTQVPSGTESFLDRLCVVLVATRNPLNIGAAARAMTNFGVSRLRVVKPYEVAFRNAKSAVGASAVLKSAKECSTIADAVADCRLVVGTTAGTDRRIHHLLRPLQQGAPLIRQKLRGNRVALLFGSEKRGLSNEDFSHCDWMIRIPTSIEQPSMNLGQAVAVCLYEVSRGARLSSVAERQPAPSAGDLERLSALLHESLLESGYPTGKHGPEIVRQLVRRLKLSRPDAQLVLGMLRQMQWKMRNPK